MHIDIYFSFRQGASFFFPRVSRYAETGLRLIVGDGRLESFSHTLLFSKTLWIKNEVSINRIGEEKGGKGGY